MFAISFYVPGESHSHPLPLQETSKQQVGENQAPEESLLCPGSWHTRHLLCVLWDWSLCFSQPCNQDPLAFKAKSLGGSSSWYQTPRLRSLTQGSLTPMGELVPCNYSLVCGSPTQESIGVDFYITCSSLPPSYCDSFFVSGCSISLFGRFHFFLIDSCSIVSCDLSVLMGGCELKSFYSMMLSSVSRVFILIEDASVPLNHGDIVGALVKMHSMWDFPGSSVAKTPCSQYRGSGFHSWWGN